MNFDEKQGGSILRRRSDSPATCLTKAKKEGRLSVLSLASQRKARCLHGAVIVICDRTAAV